MWDLHVDFFFRFKFTKIFGPNASQKDVFDECVSESVGDFVIGSNSLMFAYGTTNAGKTFTVQGEDCFFHL